jgi:hypothetical protein
MVDNVRLLVLVILVNVHNFILAQIVKYVRWFKKIDWLNFILIHKYLYTNSIYTDTNACSTGPCLNGATCTPTGTGSTYSCNCPAAYSGTNCQICNFF